MKILMAIFLVLTSSVAAAAGGVAKPLCPSTAPPNCVSTNWGQIGPGSTAEAVLGNPSAAADPQSRSAAVAVRRLEVAMSGSSGMVDTSAIRSLASPKNLFAADTARLTAAIQRARFNDDGSIASGGEAIAAAAERLVKQAGSKYQLTLYVKVPQTLAADESGSLDKKLQTLNGLLSGSGRRATGSDTRG